MGVVKEFKQFITRGSVVDLAVGVIIGAAIGKIVSSVVSDIIMPPVGLMLGGMNFTSLKIILKQASTDPTGKITEAVSINYGNFLQTGIDFLIIAAAIFIFIKVINSMKRNEEAPPPAPPTNEEVLLKEIRDLLAKKS
ncbi:MAG: large-conductance mechanosensitive channel protein MscL [Ignavibacteria bacterium]|nr:large-conductance mechanosensitive channel protein MscL [Ignavibacteria bacterium]